MKSVSIYTLTRNQNISCVQKLERQMSGRGYFLKMREWELDSMKAFVRELETHMDEVYALWFFYSFQIPRLGKEFDLLQIREDQIVNVELKSGAVSDEALRKQLIQNRYYLAVQGKTIRSYTYISSQNRLVRLTNHDRIVDADWEQLCADLRDGGKDYEGDVEELFQAELYLISPLTEPERFLNKEYFLTAQQRDIERQILKKIRAERTGAYWFTGLPGTGKTLLLYDIAMKLSGKQRVCMIHCGESKKDWKRLHERLRRVEYLPDSEIGAECGLEECSAVLVDEAQFLSAEEVDVLSDLVDFYGIPVLCYGLKTDFQNHVFEGSRRLMEVADVIEEVPTVCWCGRRAKCNARFADGKIVREGAQIMLGSNESYVALCRKHFKEGKLREED